MKPRSLPSNPSSSDICGAILDAHACLEEARSAIEALREELRRGFDDLSARLTSDVTAANAIMSRDRHDQRNVNMLMEERLNKNEKSLDELLKDKTALSTRLDMVWDKLERVERLSGEFFERNMANQLTLMNQLGVKAAAVGPNQVFPPLPRKTLAILKLPITPSGWMVVIAAVAAASIIAKVGDALFQGIAVFWKTLATYLLAR